MPIALKASSTNIVHLPLDNTWMLEKIVSCREIMNQWGSWESVIYKGKHSNRLAYRKMLPSSPKVAWRRLVRQKHVIPKCAFFTWMGV